MTFSIIVPVYKTEKYINDCVQSVLSQSFSDYECILVDDGSPDSCPSLCDDFCKNDKRIKVIHKENGGLSDARNTGILQAIGEYVIFLDSDDKLADIDTLKHLFYSIQKHETDVIINVNITEFTDDGKSLSIYKFNKDIELAPPNLIIDELKKNGMYLVGWLFVLRKECKSLPVLFIQNSKRWIYYVKYYRKKIIRFTRYYQ